MKIPIFTDDAGWHGEQLKLAFAQRGVQAIFISLVDCSLNLANPKGLNQEAQNQTPQVMIPSFAEEYPQGVFIRGVAGGTLQQVIMRLNILHMLQQVGVLVYNQGRAIERTVDKAMTSFLLRQHGVATPATWVCESRAQAEDVRQIAANQHQPLVMKPLFGSQGLGVRKLLAHEPLPVPMQQYVDGVYYLQEFILTNAEPHDYRVFVINGKVVAAMKRTGVSWINNVAAGGHCEAIQPNEVIRQLALQAAKAVDIDYCGVDIIQAESDEYYVLEVNSIPAWKGLQSVTDVNIAALLVDDFLDKLKK